MTFGIVSEGPTDQVVIEYILAAFLENRGLPVARLQPREGQAGTWDKVFRYCASDEFKGAFTTLDYVIVHIDTDFMKGKNVAANYKIDLKKLDTRQTIQAFHEKFQELIGEFFYERFKDQIIFAVAVNRMECWLMPLCFDDKAMAAQTKNCDKAINQLLSKQKGYAIKLKRAEHYQEIMEKIEGKSSVLHYAEKNPSFQIFVEELEAKVTV